MPEHAGLSSHPRLLAQGSRQAKPSPQVPVKVILITIRACSNRSKASSETAALGPGDQGHSITLHQTHFQHQLGPPGFGPNAWSP
jgi:hypothetical protein